MGCSIMITRYLLGTGYYHHPDKEDWAKWFSKLWADDLVRMNPDPAKVVCVGVGACQNPFSPGAYVHFIQLDGNCGHIHQLIGKQEPAKPHSFCGWSASIITLAMLAYTNECDFIYKEQDCLTFGPWVKQLYNELGSKKMLFGKGRGMPCAQSLFIVRHKWIPVFVQNYLGMNTDRVITDLPEHKFMRLLDIYPDQIGQFSFGVDRDRPLPFEDHVWYAQKFTPDELFSLAARSLIHLPSDMPKVKVFSNDDTNL